MKILLILTFLICSCAGSPTQTVPVNSASVSGVACCSNGGSTSTTGSGGSSNDGTNACAVGWCWTNPENVCCPYSAQYACGGVCFTTNVCNYPYYQSACHD